MRGIRRARLQATTASGGSDEAPVVPVVPFETVLEQYFGDEVVADWYSPALGKNGIAKKTTRFTAFPKYLSFRLNRYHLDKATWQPVKLDVEVPMPEELDLEKFRGTGLKEGEVQLPEDAPADSDGSGSADDGIDMEVVAQIQGMGFSENAGKRACLANKGMGAEAAANWIFGHMDDADLNDPIPEPGGGGGGGGGGDADIDMAVVVQIQGMGFSENAGKRACKAVKGAGAEAAANWIFSHMDDADLNDPLPVEPPAPVAPPPAEVDNSGPGQYELLAIISHLGKSTGGGHYVCHIKKEGKWAIFNDRKVGQSKSPPLDVGYLYIYSRKV